VGSACGQQSPYGVGNIRFILESALSGPLDGHEDKVPSSWYWWLGRLNLLDRLISRFTLEFLLEHCILVPPSPNGRFSDLDSDHNSCPTTPMDSITSTASTLAEQGPGSMELKLDGVEAGMELVPQDPNAEPSLLDLTMKDDSPFAISPMAENNLLIRAWYFAAKATHIPHNKLGKVARRVIIRVARVLRDEPFSLEIVHDVVMRCHRTQAEGLLDRVLKAREKPHESSDQKKENGGKRLKDEVDATPSEPPRRVLAVQGAGFLQDVESSLSASVIKKLSPSAKEMTEEKKQSKVGEHEFVASDDSFRSAVSDLDPESVLEVAAGKKESKERLEASSSTSDSHDSRSGDHTPSTGDHPPSKSNSGNSLSSTASGMSRGR